ncbi:MAG TPA: ATP-binding protein [Acidimicrobiia bacterium]|nr:ATP-binding protein [Acidimicrobiia bacterium]
MTVDVGSPVVRTTAATRARWARSVLVGRSGFAGMGAGALALAVATAALLPFRTGISRATPALVLVIPVVVAAVVGRRAAAVVTALGAAFVYSFAFVPPYDRVRIAQSEDVAALVVFVLVALVVGTLIASEADRRRVAERLLRHNEELVVERERLREEATRVALMERIDEQRSALLRSVSHDLRTPLATIQAVTSDLRDGTAYAPETRDRLLDLVADEAARLNRIVGNLLSLSRIETGSLQPDRQAVALDELVAERVGALERLFEGRSVDVDVSPGLPLVDADYSQLDQVITNLLENAARHAPPGSVVRVSATQTGSMIELEISDEGDGVAPDERAHIFEPFRRGRGSASSGVGLAICKAIVEAHGGAIGVGETGGGGGARFHLTLPLHDG